jgi:hypothetical protein
MTPARGGTGFQSAAKSRPQLPFPQFASELPTTGQATMQPNVALNQESDRINQMRSSLHKERLATFAGRGGQTPAQQSHQPQQTQSQQQPPQPRSMASMATPQVDRSQLNRSTATTPNGSLVERSKDLFSTARVVLSQDAFDGFLATIRSLNDKKLGQAEALDRCVGVGMLCSGGRRVLAYVVRMSPHPLLLLILIENPSFLKCA